MLKIINFLILFIVTSSVTVQSQINQIVELEEFYSNKPYRLSGYIKTLDLGKLEFWAFQKDKNGKVLKDQLKRETLSANSNWSQILLHGKIQKGINTLTFGIWGTKTIEKFNIDKISLEIYDAGQWKPIEIRNGELEEPIPNASKLNGWTLSVGYTANNDSSAVYSGIASLRLTQEELVKYGNFNKYGASAHLNNIDIYYEIYGEGEPLLLLHGNNESINSFKHQIDYLREKYKVIAVDSRGQGKSTNDKKRITYELMAKDMHELLNYLKLDSVNILGWSDGGNTGLIMAMNYPEKVKSLTTMGANLNPSNNAIEKKFLTEYKRTIRVAKIFSFFKPSKWRNKVIVGKMPLKEPNINPTDLNKIKAHVLVLAGEKDIVKESHTKIIAENINRSQLQILKGLTHYAPQEDPSHFNKVIEEFLSKVAKN